MGLTVEESRLGEQACPDEGGERSSAHEGALGCSSRSTGLAKLLRLLLERSRKLRELVLT